jgi:ribosomal protein S18 acetylase RimI-like enzyme
MILMQRAPTLPPQQPRRRCCRIRASAATSPPPPPAAATALRVRRATTAADVESVATLAAEVFGGFEFARQPTATADAENNTTPKLLAALEQRRATLVADDVRTRLSAALAQKREAQQAQRAVTLEWRARSLRAALEAARLGLSPQEVAAEAASRPRAETRAEVRERERRRRDRAFATLLAVVGSEDDQSAVVGIATVSLRRPEAALPPPFPSSAPLRAYLSDMAVSPSARRRGAARLLLERACALARRWGEDSLWLHVAADNEGAVALYQNAGFERVKGGSGGAAVAAALAGLAAGGSGGGKQVLMVRRF